MSKQITKKQHYVPQFYLRYFSNYASGNKKAFCYTLDMKNKNVSLRRVEDQAFKDFFYALETGKFDEMSQDIENEFSLAEGIWAEWYRELLAKFSNREILSNEFKQKLADILSHMLVRTEYSRDEINHNLSQSHKDSFALVPDEVLTKDIDKHKNIKKESIEKALELIRSKNYELEFNNSWFIQLYNDQVEIFYKMFYFSDLVVHINKTQMLFFTSTQPVSREIIKTEMFYRVPPIGCRHLFPFSSEIMLEFIPNFNEDLKSNMQYSEICNVKEVVELSKRYCLGTCGYSRFYFAKNSNSFPNTYERK